MEKYKRLEEILTKFHLTDLIINPKIIEKYNEQYNKNHDLFDTYCPNKQETYIMQYNTLADLLNDENLYASLNKANIFSIIGVVHILTQGHKEYEHDRNGYSALESEMLENFRGNTDIQQFIQYLVSLNTTAISIGYDMNSILYNLLFEKKLLEFIKSYSHIINLEPQNLEEEIDRILTEMRSSGLPYPYVKYATDTDKNNIIKCVRDIQEIRQNILTNPQVQIESSEKTTTDENKKKIKDRNSNNKQNFSEILKTAFNKVKELLSTLKPHKRK